MNISRSSTPFMKEKTNDRCFSNVEFLAHSPYSTEIWRISVFRCVEIMPLADTSNIVSDSTWLCWALVFLSTMLPQHRPCQLFWLLCVTVSFYVYPCYPFNKSREVAVCSFIGWGRYGGRVVDVLQGRFYDYGKCLFLLDVDSTVYDFKGWYAWDSYYD